MADFAETSAELVTEDDAGETHENRGQRDEALQVRVLSTGRGGGHAQTVRCDPRPHGAAGKSTTAGHVR